jgi:hypothetical protein
VRLVMQSLRPADFATTASPHCTCACIINVSMVSYYDVVPADRNQRDDTTGPMAWTSRDFKKCERQILARKVLSGA